jgi:hypothetical protein
MGDMRMEKEQMPYQILLINSLYLPPTYAAF